MALTASSSAAANWQTALLGGHVIAFIGDIIYQAHDALEGRQSVAALPAAAEKMRNEIAVRRARDAMALFVRTARRIGDFFLVAGGRLRSLATR